MFKAQFYWIILLCLFIAGALVFQFAYHSKTRIAIAVVDTGLDFKQIKFRFAASRGFNIFDPNKPPQDDNGHGTQVASIIHFLEPRVEIVPIKAIPKSGVATKQELAEGIIAAVDRGAKIINISAGVVSPSPDLENAVRYAEDRGVVVVAAVGGSGMGIEYPAAYPAVLAVGAVDHNNTRLPNSNTGPELDLVALGQYITTGLRGQCYTNGGTSLATPVVSVYAARMLINNPNLKPREVRDALLSLVVDIGDPNKDSATGHGLLRQEEVTFRFCK